MKKSELAAVAANGYWREPEARVALAAWRTSGETFLETAKLHAIDPAAYLLEAVRRADRGEVLLPWESLP